MAKKFWKCSSCHGIHKKENLETEKLLVEQADVLIVGGITCADCGTRHEIYDVVRGKHDLKQSDKDIEDVLAHPGNYKWSRFKQMWKKK